MRFYRKPRFWLIAGIVLILLVFVIPPLLGIAFRGKIEEKLQAATQAPVKLGSVSINLLPPGATLSALEIGAPDPAAGNKPLIALASLRANVSLGMLFGGSTHLTRLSLSGLDVNIHVDGTGASSFNRFLRKLPPSDRTSELPIDALYLSNVQIHTWAGDGREPSGTTAVSNVYASGLVLPAPGTLLGREAWIDVDLRGIALTAPPDSAAAKNAATPPEGSVADGAFVESISLRMTQAPNTDKPIVVRDMVISRPELATVFTTPGAEPAVRRAIAALQLATGGSESETAHGSGAAPAAPQGAGILIDDLKVVAGRIETRGPDPDGKPAFWRLNGLNATVKNLAFGPHTASAGGEVQAASSSESSSGPGQMKLSATDIRGGYPHWTCQVAYAIDGIAGAPFSAAANQSAHTGIRAGTLAMQFAGPVQDGNLKLDGSLTLSRDFEVTGAAQKAVVELSRGEPIGTVRVRGTLQAPRIAWPDAIAGALGNAFEKIIIGSPVGVLDTMGGFMGGATGQGMREAGKTLKGAGDLLKKVPGMKSLEGIFGGGSGEKKDGGQ